MIIIMVVHIKDCQSLNLDLHDNVIQVVRHPFERLVSAYQSKVVRSTDEWYFLVFVLNDTF